MFDLRHPFFNPLWRRVLTVAVCAGWALVEFSQGNTGWAAVFGGLGLWAGIVFFYKWEDQPPVDRG
ncbi:hypothetical protein ACOXXX_07915 [Thalassococcus sp. BH17M4-6]|uniref:hypothetical protein n=1 Tax=Thalassococcus sp. BH17M4-6 TaxID=3413148 RepID=UPI003BE12484